MMSSAENGVVASNHREIFPTDGVSICYKSCHGLNLKYSSHHAIPLKCAFIAVGAFLLIMDILTVMRTAEFDFAGFLVPWAMLIWCLAYIAALVVSRLIERCGGYRHVWHPPLLFVALVIIIGSSVGILLAP